MIVHVGQGQAVEFLFTDTAGVQYLQDHPVPVPDHSGGVRGMDDPPGFGWGQYATGQGFGRFGILDVPCRIRHDKAPRVNCLTAAIIPF